MSDHQSTMLDQIAADLRPDTVAQPLIGQSPTLAALLTDEHIAVFPMAGAR